MTDPHPPRRLYRSRTDRKLGGVAGGIGHYFGVDPTLVRLAWVLLLLAGGIGLLAYLIAWLVIPEEPVGTGPGPARPAASGPAPGPGARLIIGGILILVGVLLLLEWAIPDIDEFLWPAALIAFGTGMVLYGARR